MPSAVVGVMEVLDNTSDREGLLELAALERLDEKPDFIDALDDRLDRFEVSPSIEVIRKERNGSDMDRSRGVGAGDG